MRTDNSHHAQRVLCKPRPLQPILGSETHGLLSRMIPFSCEYPIDKIAKIFDYIMSGRADDNSKVVVPKIR
ncbi:hypothetical protein KEJ32_03340 [Candidatus Bathyarchaeota archaeon]|nr:hypothetical protein [Candidatus Bathyarchaeota archaeon]